MAAASTRVGQRGPRYRRRRPFPALMLLCALVVLSGFMWTRTLETTDNVEAATRCNPPGTAGTASASLGVMLPRNGLDGTAPSPPQDIPVRVLNGNGESRQASLVSQELSSLGFAQGGKADDDPIYPNYDLNCHGQIRFGAAGASGARTLSLMVPCAQLVRDERQGTAVDLALGAKFDDIKSTSEAKQIMQDLKTSVPQGEQTNASQGGNAFKIDGKLLQTARDVHC